MSICKWVTAVRDVAREIKDLNRDIPDEAIIVISMDSRPDS